MPRPPGFPVSDYHDIFLLHQFIFIRLRVTLLLFGFHVVLSVSECSALKYISNFKKSRKIMITDTYKSSGNNSIMEILQVVYFFIFCVSLCRVIVIVVVKKRRRHIFSLHSTDVPVSIPIFPLFLERCQRCEYHYYMTRRFSGNRSNKKAIV